MYEQQQHRSITGHAYQDSNTHNHPVGSLLHAISRAKGPVYTVSSATTPGGKGFSDSTPEC